jgi:hypothetical protein
MPKLSFRTVPQIKTAYVAREVGILAISGLDATNVQSALEELVTENGSLVQSVSMSGDISPSQITSNQNNYNPTGLSTASVLRISSDAPRNITGLAGGSDGRIITLINIGSHPITLKNETTSTELNRFLPGADFILASGCGVILWYDSTSQRWRTMSQSVDLVPWIAYTPTVSAASGTITSASATGFYKVFGKTVHVQITIVITTNGTGADTVRATLPFTASTSDFVLNGYSFSGGTGLVCPIFSFDPTRVHSLRYDGAYPGADGASLLVSGTYEMT